MRLRWTERKTQLDGGEKKRLRVHVNTVKTQMEVSTQGHQKETLLLCTLLFSGGATCLLFTEKKSKWKGLDINLVYANFQH